MKYGASDDFCESFIGDGVILQWRGVSGDFRHFTHAELPEGTLLRVADCRSPARTALTVDAEQSDRPERRRMFFEFLPDRRHPAGFSEFHIPAMRLFNRRLGGVFFVSVFHKIRKTPFAPISRGIVPEEKSAVESPP